MLKYGRFGEPTIENLARKWQSRLRVRQFHLSSWFLNAQAIFLNNKTFAVDSLFILKQARESQFKKYWFPISPKHLGLNKTLLSK